MLIQMLETRKGSDGDRARLYLQGSTYAVSELLGHAFLAAGFAVRIPRPKRSRILSLVVNQKQSGKTRLSDKPKPHQDQP